MLTIHGSHNNRVNRREFLKVGVLGMAGLTLPDMLRLRAQAGTPSRPKSVIMICLAGGPSHIDMYDLKPDAPSEYRGEFSPIRTNVPGFDISEVMPLQARIADKLALVRTVQYVEPMQHELQEVYSGFIKAAQRPAFGSFVSRFQGGDPRLPAYVSLDYNTGVSAYESPEYLGAMHRPLYIAGGPGVQNLSLQREIPRPRLEQRRGLLDAFDNYRREVDRRREGEDLDAYTSRALDIITSPRAREAFDMSKEPLALRERYGSRTDMYTYVGRTPDTYWEGEKLLLARRLVEAGVPMVTLRLGGWDHHGNVIQSQGGVSIWHSLRTVLPLLDRSIHALVTDLHDRGLDKDVAVLIWGEMGRTPRSALTGRDHWMDAGFALFAGGVKTGQVIGQTNSRAEEPRTRAVKAQNVLATLYHFLGIDPSQRVPDFSGRPQYLLDDREPIAELL